VLLNLDREYGLKAGKNRGAECVEVKWKKVEAGACYVKYEVVLKNSLGSIEYATERYNMGELTLCSYLTFSSVTDVQLTVSFKSMSRIIITKVSDTQLTTPTPTTPGSLSGGFTWNYELIVRRIVLFWKVNGQVLSPVEANSSSSHVITIKGSSLWLHWNYTYIGDGVHGPLAVNYSEQITGFTTTSQPSIETFAKRTGQNGALTLESSVPAPFNRRVEVISANSTFVIHDLQYNDSTYQFSSSVSVDEDAGGGAVNIVVLKPIVSITVNGIPDFIVRPPLPWM